MPAEDVTDLAALAERSRGMADGLRIVLERSRGPLRSLGELSADEPELRTAIERAGARQGRRLWFLGRSGRRLWPDEVECVAGCYETLAEAAGLLRCVEGLRSLDQARCKQAYELAAEAQSALRKALRDLAGLRRSDEDRQALFDWLHAHRAHRHFYIERHMRHADSADPWSWRERQARIRTMREGLREALHQQRQADELDELARYHALKIPERCDEHERWGDWRRIDQTVAWLDRIGSPVPAELREALVPLARRLPAGLRPSHALAALLDSILHPPRRRAPRSTRAGTPSRRTRTGAPASVLQVFRAAERCHPERIAYRPNNHSDPDYPYARPEEVERAVEWLVGPYWETRTGLRRADHRELDHLLREACGWSYKRSQSQATVGQFRSWYEATCEGRKVAIHEHIGRGNAKRQGAASIRIGFAWDDILGKIVVGFVGQHQRNRDS